ncbi:unnamed protein product [Rotaria sordida]|uniref:Uncharacterized protein n=2 Tax=Rotaria sordida TaxID=392033 RepID=A0A813VKJ5_9BILA|nr:unnamed protein product [Rotaria sordida]
MMVDDEDNINNNNNIFNEIDDEDWILEKPISVFALDPADRRVLKVADQRDAVQKKTFTKWINFHLSKREGLHVDDLFLDLRDGHLLISLLEIFTNQTIPRERGTSKFHALQNVEQCLQCLEQHHNIRLVNIRPEELVNGNPKLTLGLIWRIILHFQFSDISIPSSEENIPINVKQTIAPIPTTDLPSSNELKPDKIPPISSTTERKSSIDQISSNYRNMLLIWARQQCQGYPGIYIDDFTRSWRNGRAFLAILHRHNPQLINIKEAYSNSNRENLMRAFDFAQKHYGIMQLIDPEDVDTDEPDEKSILLYIAHLYKVCSTLPTHPFQQEHDRIHLESELSYEYTNLASDLLKWIKIKLDFLNREIKFKSIDEIETYQSVLQAIKQDEMNQYNKVLHRMRSIDAEFETSQLTETLEPDINSINLAWNKLEMTIDRVEYDLKQFLQQYEKLKDNINNDLDLIERDIANIERLIQIKSKQLEIVDTINQLNHIQINLDTILNNYRTLALPYEQIQTAIERIDQLNLRIDNLHVQLSPSPPSSSTILKISSPTTTRILDPSSLTTSNGYHHSSKKQGRSNQLSNFFTNSSTGIEQLDVIVTGDYRRSGDTQQQQQQQQQQSRSNTMVVDSGHLTNETKSFVLVDELNLINNNLNTLSQLLQQRITCLLQTGLPTSHDDLLLLYQEHKSEMPRSSSITSDDYPQYPRSSRTKERSVPIELVFNRNKDYYSSNINPHRRRTSSISSFCSSSTASSANYRILPVRYSSVDRIIEEPATVTADKHGIYVRIHFIKPRAHHHHHHHHHYYQHEHSYQRTEEHEYYDRKEHQRYGSCPVLNNNNIQYSNSTLNNQRRQSNRRYLEVPSISRGSSSDQLNRNNHSSTLIIRHQSLPPSNVKQPPSNVKQPPSLTVKQPSPLIIHTKITHIPLDTYAKFKPIMTRDFENDLLSQASRIKDIRNKVRQEYNSSSHQELRSLVNQTSDYAQDLFTISKDYSDKLDIAETTLNLVTDLTSHIIELETRLASHTPLIDDENYIHRQFDDLNELEKQLQSIEKSIKELLIQSKQLGNDKLIRISEQLTSRWQQMNSEINQRKRSITQCMETHRSFETLHQQEERILDNLQQRIETLEPVSNDPNKLRQSGKTVTDLFNEILSRAQSIEHMNDVAVKFIEEAKMHDKNLKRFRVSLRDIHPSLDASVSIVRRQYPTNIQRATRAILHKIEVFDRRYADLLATMEEYARAFVKNYNTTGQTINLPLDSASTIVHLYRSTIVSRYNITLQFLLSSDDDDDDDDDEQSLHSSSSTKRNRHKNNKTGFVDLTRGKVSTDRHSYPLSSSSLDGSVSLESSYVIPTTQTDTLNNKKVRFIIQKQPGISTTNGNILITNTKLNDMAQRKNLSFVDAVNSKHLDLSTGLFSFPLPFVLSSSPFSSSTILSPDHHHHTYTHFSSSSSSPPRTTITTDNKNFPTSSVNNHPSHIGTDSINTTKTITLKEAIDTNILDAHSAYVVDTLERRNYDLREAYSRGLINFNDHHIIDRVKNQRLTLADALKMGILKVGDPQSYNIISKTESLVISSVFDHRLNTYIDPNTAIKKKILDPYHGLYLNNITQEAISIDDAMNRNLIIVEQQSSHTHSNQPSDKYVISTSLIRETRSYHLLGVRDYINNKELSVQEAIRLGILDKQNGQYINRKTNEIFSISEAIAQGHIRAQPLPVESSSSTTTTNTQETIGTSNVKRGTVKETKTYTLKSAIHPRTRKEIPIRQAIDEGIIDHARGFYVNSLTGENLPISIAIEKGLIFTELIDQHSKHYIKYFIIDHIIDPITNRRLGITEAIQTGLLNTNVTIYNHPIKQRQIPVMEAYEQGLIIGKFSEQRPSSFINDQRHQTSYLITDIIDARTDKIYSLQEAIEHRIFDRRKGVYIHPITNDEITIGDAIKRGLIQVQSVVTQITDHTRSNFSIHIESQPQAIRPTTASSQLVQREQDIIEIESVQRVPRRRHHHRTTEEVVEQTTNVVDQEVYVNRARSSERPKQRYIEEVIIDDRSRPQPRTVDIQEDRQYIHKEINIQGEQPRPPPPPPKTEVYFNEEIREHEYYGGQPSRPQPPIPPPRPYPSTTTTRKEYVEIETERIKPSRPDDWHEDQQQSWSEEEWEQWHCIMMKKDKPYRVVWVMNTATGDRLPLQNAYQRGLVDIKQRLFFDEKLNRQSYSFEKAVDLGYMGIEPDTASLPIRVDGIDYMIHWVLDSSTKRRIFPRQAIAKNILDSKYGRYINPYNNSQVSLHEAIHLKFVGATEYGPMSDSLIVTINGQPYNIKWVYDTVHMKKILPRDALRQGILDIQLNEYRKLDTNDVMTIYDAIQAGYIRCSDDESSSDNSIKPPSIISVDEDELTIATKTATYVITSVIHPLTQKEIKVSEAIDLGILDKETGSYRDLVTNVQYELAEAINEGLVYATIIETKEDTEMMTSSLQEIVKKFIVKSVAVDSDSQEKIGGLEAQAVGILNYAQGVYNDRKYGVKIPLDKAIERKLLDVELVSQKKFEEYDLELITDTITEKRITLYKIHGVQNNVLGRLESGAVAVRNQMIDTEAKTYTDFSTGETMSIQEAVNRNLIQAEISEHVERKPLGLSMQNAIRLGFYVPETGTFRDPATEHYMTLMEAIERGHIHVNGVAFADSEQGPITLYDAFSLGLINRRDGGKLNPAKMTLYRARLVESKLHRMNVEDAIRCGLLNLRTGLYKHPHSGEQLNLKEAIQRGLIDGQSTVIENPSTGRYMTLKDALDGIRIDNDGQVIDSYSNKVITTLEVAYNHRKLFSQFDVNAGEIFLPSQNESIGFEKAVRKNLLDNNRIKLFDPKTSREYTIQDAIERGLIDHESGLIYDTRSRTTYSIREAIRHGIITIVGAPLVPIKADHETVAAKITSRNHRRHSLAKSSLHFDYNSAPDSADEDSHASSGWHRITSKNRPSSPLSTGGKRSIRRRTGSSPSRNNNTNRFTCRDDDWRTGWKGGHKDDDDDVFGGGGGSKRTGGNSYYTRKSQRTQSHLHVCELTSTLNNNDNQKPNDLVEHKSGMSHHVQPNTQVSNEPPPSKVENIHDDDDDEDFLDASNTNESSFDTVIEKKQENINDNSFKIKDNEKSIQNDDNRIIIDIHDTANRLTSLHDQLNQYVYLTDNLNELQTNVQQIKTLHSGVEKEKTTIDNLIERTNQFNPQLVTLSQDLEEKRVEIADINSGLSDIIERFITQVNQFNTEYNHLSEWLEINNKEIQKPLELSTLNNDNEKFQKILTTTINLQNDLKNLQEHLQLIGLTIQDFEQATGNTDGGKSANIYKQLQQRFDILSTNYTDFLKRCKQISDQCERYMLTYNEVNNLNEQIIKSMNEFDQNLASNKNQQQDDNTLQVLLLNVQQQLDKLSMLATHEPMSSSPIMSSSYHIQNQLKEHLGTLLDSHTQHYNDAQQGLMNNFELLEHDKHERQTIKERIDELNNWLLSYTDKTINSNDLFSKPLSLKRSKLDEQIINFRQFHAQLLKRRHSFETDINRKINLEQLFDNNDKKTIDLINKSFQLLDEQANQYNERINRLSTRLNEFHLEHSHLIDNYSKRLRLYSEHIEQNDDINFSTLQLLLNNNNDLIIDHTLYEQLKKELIETNNIEDQDEIYQYEKQINQYKNQYNTFENNLKLILSQREQILNEYESNKNVLQEWLLTTERLLKQQPNELTIDKCQQLLNEHNNMPIEQIKLLNQKLIEFYSSSNLKHLYEQLNLNKNKQHNTNIIKIVQRQTDELIENYLLIKEKILQHINLLEKIQQQTHQYQLAKQKAENSIEKAKELVTLEENTILPLDNQQIEIMLKRYKDIADQLKHMTSTIDEYRTSGLTLINTAQRYIDTEPIQNEIASIDKSWSEYVEYILDTIDYIQLHQEDLREFHQLSNDLIDKLNEKQIEMQIINDNELKTFSDDLEKYYEQVELINHKGELLLQSSAVNLNDDNENKIERLLEIINRNYDSLTINTKIRLENINHIQQSTTQLPTTTTTTTTITPEEQISPEITNKLTNELHHHLDETVLAMNELSELLVSSTGDTISAQPIKLSEQLLDNAAVESELERRKIALEQLHSNIVTLKQITTNPEDIDSIKALDEKFTQLNEHWLIMKQANDIRTENLLLTQTCANTFWSQHNELTTFLNNIDKQLSQIRPRSTSREHIEHEKEKYQQLMNDFSNNEIKYKEILHQHSPLLLTLISNNQDETDDIQRNLNELEQEWNRIEINLNQCQNQLEQAMIESNEFNNKLERVSTWFDDTLFPLPIEDNNEFERIRIFKEHLDCKYLDIINLKQDYTDIEQHKQQRTDGTIQQDEHDMEETEKTNLVEEQLINIDSKWTQLNEKVQEHKTLIYETALRQNRIDDVITDINRSLDNCSSKLSVLINSSLDMNLNDMKQIEISIAKLRILLNDIELISYDIEQLKQNSSEDKNSIISINNQWEELLKQATDKYNYLENKLEYMKLKQKTIDHIYYALDLIDKQVNESTINTKFPLLVERLEYIEEEINKEFSNDNNNQQIEELKKRLIDVKQRTLTKGQELIELAHSIELFHSTLQKFTEWLNETERYLNNLKPVQRRFALIQTLLKQIDDHELFQAQLQTYKEHLIDLDKLATHLKFVSPKNDSIYIRNSLIAVQTRWQKILTRTTERTKELQKAFQETKKTIRPEITDIDRIKNEVNRQASLCTCSKKYDVQQVSEGRYRFGESQSLRLVRILRSTVMVRVGGGWTALDEFLVRHDPCRGRLYYMPEYQTAKGRTNYELHPESYALRDGVAQTMTLFKPRLVTVHRPTCLFHQQQLATGGISKQSPVTTPIRGTKDKSRRTSSTISLTQQQQQNSASVGDLSVSGDDLSTSPHVLSDSEVKPSHIPIAVAATTPVTATLSRTSSRESDLSEHSIASTSSSQQRRPSKLPLPISRNKKTTNGTTPAKNS